MKSLHVPTRRENFNSHVSIKLGNNNDTPIKMKNFDPTNYKQSFRG